MVSLLCKQDDGVWWSTNKKVKSSRPHKITCNIKFYCDIDGVKVLLSIKVEVEFITSWEEMNSWGTEILEKVSSSFISSFKCRNGIRVEVRQWGMSAIKAMTCESINLWQTMWARMSEHQVLSEWDSNLRATRVWARSWWCWHEECQKRVSSWSIRSYDI